VIFISALFIGMGVNMGMLLLGSRVIPLPPGAFLVSGFAKSDTFRYSMLIAGFFFLGGLSTIVGMPSPLWFSITDLLLSYFPMDWFAHNFAKKLKCV